MGDGRQYNGYLNAALPTDRHVHVSMGIVSRVGATTKIRYASVTSHGQHDEEAHGEHGEHDDHALGVIEEQGKTK